MQTFQSKMADNQSQQAAKALKIQTHTSLPVQVFLFFFSLFGSKLAQNRDAQQLEQNGRGCLHTHDGLEATVVRRSAQWLHSKKVCLLPCGVCPAFTPQTSIFKGIATAPGCERTVCVVVCVLRWTGDLCWPLPGDCWDRPPFLHHHHPEDE